MAEKLIPENDLEILLVKVQQGKIDFVDFFKFFMSAEIFVPSASEVMPDGSGMSPLLFEKNGDQILGVFSSLSRVSLFKGQADYCLSMKGRELIARLPAGYGIVVNPGFDKGFDVPPSGIKKILRDFDS